LADNRSRQSFETGRKRPVGWRAKTRQRSGYIGIDCGKLIKRPTRREKFLLHDCHKQKLSGFTNACQISMNLR
jgi:hypothetical protein